MPESKPATSSRSSRVLKYTPDEIDAGGGVEARLWELGVSTVTVRELRVTLIETQLSSSDSDGESRNDMAEIDEALAAAMSSRDYDQAILARLIGEPEAIRDYLQQVYIANAARAAVVAVGERLSALAEIAAMFGRDGVHEHHRALAEGLAGMDKSFQRQLLVEEVLPESRTSASLAGVVRQMGFYEVSKLFVDGVTTGEADKAELVRAIRGLALISPSERQEIVQMAGSVMLNAGMSEAEIAEVLEAATPTRLTVRPSPSTGAARPADAIFSLLDISLAPRDLLEADAALAAIQDEATRGITDGDVISAMVTLVSLESRPAQFASNMSMLEDSLDYLIESGAVEVAAEAAVSLGDAAKNPSLSPEQRLRVEAAIDRFARPSDIRELARTMRVYPKGSAEYEAARQLIDLLGRAALKPLLENLADEPDMAARKSLVDLLSTMANDYIPQIGACLSDSRWYFVRNVVAILGAAKSSAVLIYLERTLRHSDERVRRETIRALSGIHDRLAIEMLVASLHDDDVQNVQLAARYLGQAGALTSVPALEEVARGQGRGNRDTGPRVEAIEALGRLGATEAMPTLEALAGKRSILDGGKSKDLRAAATAAIGAIKAKGVAR